MKHRKKWFALLAVCMAAALSVSACAADPSAASASPSASLAPVEAETPVELPPISLYDAYHIPGIQHSGSDYSDSFTCHPEDGNRLNIFVRNDGVGAVVVNITWEDNGMVKEYPAFEIPVGGQHTKTYLYEDGAGINGLWTVEVTTTSGHPLNIWVSACAANEDTPAESPIISPRLVEIEDNIRASNGTYTSSAFTCPSTNGNTLRIFYRDESGNAAKVVLQKQGFFGSWSKADDMEISGNGEGYFTYDNPGGKTFRIVVHSMNGGEVEGYLRANQLDL